MQKKKKGGGQRGAWVVQKKKKKQTQDSGSSQDTRNTGISSQGGRSSGHRRDGAGPRQVALTLGFASGRSLSKPGMA